MARSAPTILSLLSLSVLCGVAHSGAGDAISGARIAAVSAPWLGRPYRLDPLGEGVGAVIDPDPRWRTDAFDCLTFVETVMAVAATAEVPAAREQLRRIRYRDGQVEFAARNHFPEADWLINNEQAGFIQDVTQSVAQASGQAAGLTETRGVARRGPWLRRLAQASHRQRARDALLALAASARDTHVTLRYLRLRELPVEALRSVVGSLPSGAILFIVRPNTNMLGAAGAVTQLSHVGFALRDAAGEWMYRNASSTRARRVLDSPLLPYLRRMQSTRSFAGIVVLQALQQPTTKQIP